MEKEKEEFDEFSKTLLDNMKETNELYFSQYSEALRQKNIWLIQLITISGTIFGGFILSQQKQSLTVNIGLGILYTVVFIGITLIYRENKNQITLIQKGIKKNIDYWINAIINYNLSKKQNLTDIELKRKQESQEYLDNFFKESGFLKEDGTLGNLFEKLDDKKIDWNYLLLLGFFISILIIIFPNYFEVILYWLKNILTL